MSWPLQLTPRFPGFRGVLAWGGRPRGCGASFAAMSVPIDVVINGQPRSVNTGSTIADLIADLGLAGKPVAVERNREVVPRAQHATTILAPGDRLEVVTFVGGG